MMDELKEFNSELSSLYSIRPPISKAKMNEITRLALKAIKYYKHVVQSIEKFIHKCQQEYKVPGLYVIDSIIRQSKHQNGIEKEPFTQRFSRNIAVTFHNLLNCPTQDISKIVRVLNLWQKNTVFSSQIIQPLLDMAANPQSYDVYLTAQRDIEQVTGLIPSVPIQSTSSSSNRELRLSGSLPGAELDLALGADVPQVDLRALTQMITPQQPLQSLFPLLNNQQLQMQLLQQQLFQQQLMPEPQALPLVDGNLMAQIQALTVALMARISSSNESSLPVATSSPVAKQQKTTEVSFSESDDDRRDLRSCSSVSLTPAPASETSRENPGKSHFLHPAESSSSKKLKETTPRQWSPVERKETRRYSPVVTRELFSPSEYKKRDHSQEFRWNSPSPGYVPAVSPEMGKGLERFSTAGREQSQKSSRMKRTAPRADSPIDLDFETVKCDRSKRKPSLEPEKNIPDWSTKLVESSKRDSRRKKPDKYYVNKPEEMWTEIAHDFAERKKFNSSRSPDQGQSMKVVMRDKEKRRKDDEYISTKPVELDIAQSRSTEKRMSRSRSKSKKLSRSRSRSPLRVSSHSQSSSKKSRRSRSKSRGSRSHQKEKDRKSRKLEKQSRKDSMESDEKEEKIAEVSRHRIGFPPLKERHACICSTTLWIGHVSRHTREDELKKELLKYGKPVFVNLASRQSCAFVGYDTRQEAVDALKLINGVTILGKVIKATWAPGIGIKNSEFKNRWDVDFGITYIPWDKLPRNIDAIAEGGVVDEGSLPEHFQDHQRSDSIDITLDDQNTVGEVTSSTDCRPKKVKDVTLHDAASVPPSSSSQTKLSHDTTDGLNPAKSKSDGSLHSHKIQNISPTAVPQLIPDISRPPRSPTFGHSSLENPVGLPKFDPTQPPPRLDLPVREDKDASDAFDNKSDDNMSIDEEDEQDVQASRVEIISWSEESSKNIKHRDKSETRWDTNLEEKKVNSQEEIVADKNLDGLTAVENVKAPEDSSKMDVCDLFKDGNDAQLLTSSDNEESRVDETSLKRSGNVFGKKGWKVGKMTDAEATRADMKGVLKGKIKFGIISTLSGWKKSRAVAAAATEAAMAVEAASVAGPAKNVSLKNGESEPSSKMGSSFDDKKVSSADNIDDKLQIDVSMAELTADNPVLMTCQNRPIEKKETVKSDGRETAELDDGKTVESDNSKVEVSNDGNTEESDGGKIEESDGGKIEKSDGGKIVELDPGHIVKSDVVQAVDADNGNTVAQSVKQLADQPVDPVKTLNTVKSSPEKSDDVELGVSGSTDDTNQQAGLHLKESTPTGIPLPPNACLPSGISPMIQDWKGEMLSPPPAPFMTMPPRPTGVVGGPGVSVHSFGLNNMPNALNHMQAGPSNVESNNMFGKANKNDGILGPPPAFPRPNRFPSGPSFGMHHGLSRFPGRMVGPQNAGADGLLGEPPVLHGGPNKLSGPGSSNGPMSGGPGGMSGGPGGMSGGLGGMSGGPGGMSGGPGGMSGGPGGMPGGPGGMSCNPGGMSGGPEGMPGVPIGMPDGPVGMPGGPGGMLGGPRGMPRGPGGILSGPGGMPGGPGGMSGGPGGMPRGPGGMPRGLGGMLGGPVGLPGGPGGIFGGPGGMPSELEGGMAGGPGGMAGGPGGMSGGPGGMAGGPGEMAGGPGGMAGGPGGMAGGQGGMAGGPGGMAGGPGGMAGGPGGMAGGPGGMAGGPGGMAGGPGGMTGGPGGMAGGQRGMLDRPGRMSFEQGCPDALQFGQGRQQRILDSQGTSGQVRPNGAKFGMQGGMPGGPGGMQGEPGVMPGGPGGMPGGPGGMQGGPGGMQGGPGGMQGGPGGMQGGPGGMQGGPGGMQGGPGGMQGGPGGMQGGPGGMQFGQSGMHSGPGGVHGGPNNMQAGQPGGMHGGLGGMHGGPGGMLGGPGGMKGGPGGMQGGPGGMQGGPGGMQGGPSGIHGGPGGIHGGPGGMHGGPGGRGGMHFGPNNMRGGPDGLQGGSGGMPGEPGGMQGGPGGMQGGPGGMQGGPGGMHVGPDGMHGRPGGMQGGPGDMQGRPRGMQGGPGGMQGGPGGMHVGPDGMHGGPGGMQGGPGSMQSGPGGMHGGPVGMHGGPGGMQGGPRGMQGGPRMQGGPGGMHGGSGGMQGGPGGMHGGPGGMQGGPGGMHGRPGGVHGLLGEEYSGPKNMQGGPNSFHGGPGGIQRESDGMKGDFGGTFHGPGGKRGGPDGMHGRPRVMQGGSSLLGEPGGLHYGPGSFLGGPGMYGSRQGPPCELQQRPNQVQNRESGCVQGGPSEDEGRIDGVPGRQDDNKNEPYGMKGSSHTKEISRDVQSRPQGGRGEPRDGPFGIHGGPGGMQSGPGSSIPGGPGFRPFGPGGMLNRFNDVSSGPGGMQGGPGGMQGGPVGMQGGPGGMQGGPGGMQGGPGGMQGGPGGMQGGPGGMQGGPGVMQGGPGGMQGGLGGMQGGPSGMHGGPGGMHGGPGGMHGDPGGMHGGPGGMHGGPGGMHGGPGGMHGGPGGIQGGPGGMHGGPGHMQGGPGSIQGGPGGTNGGPGGILGGPFGIHGGPGGMFGGPSGIQSGPGGMHGDPNCMKGSPGVMQGGPGGIHFGQGGPGGMHGGPANVQTGLGSMQGGPEGMFSPPGNPGCFGDVPCGPLGSVNTSSFPNGQSGSRGNNSQCGPSGGLAMMSAGQNLTSSGPANLIPNSGPHSSTSDSRTMDSSDKKFIERFRSNKRHSTLPRIYDEPEETDDGEMMEDVSMTPPASSGTVSKSLDENQSLLASGSVQSSEFKGDKKPQQSILGEPPNVAEPRRSDGSGMLCFPGPGFLNVPPPNFQGDPRLPVPSGHIGPAPGLPFRSNLPPPFQQMLNRPPANVIENRPHLPNQSTPSLPIQPLGPMVNMPLGQGPLNIQPGTPGLVGNLPPGQMPNQPFGQLSDLSGGLSGALFGSEANRLKQNQQFTGSTGVQLGNSPSQRQVPPFGGHVSSTPSELSAKFGQVLGLIEQLQNDRQGRPMVNRAHDHGGDMNMQFDAGLNRFNQNIDKPPGLLSDVGWNPFGSDGGKPYSDVQKPKQSYSRFERNSRGGKDQQSDHRSFRGESSGKFGNAPRGRFQETSRQQFGDRRGSDPQQDRNRWQDRQAGQTNSPGEPFNKNGDGSCKDETVSRVCDKKQSVDNKHSAAYDPFDASDHEDRTDDVLIGDGSWHSEPEKLSNDVAATAGDKSKLRQESKN